MTPKVSVVIPVYNSAKFLRPCLDSIVSQSFSDWEVVAVDDGSSDESPAILDEYAAKDSRFKIIHKENGGVSAARNDGLAAAAGEYVLFVDSDDWMDGAAFQMYWDEVCRTGADVVISDHWTWKENGVETEHQFFAQDFVVNDKTSIQALQRTVLYRGYSPYPSARCGYMFSALWSKLIRRQLLLENGILFSRTLKLYEDGLFALQVFQFAKSIAYKQVPTYHYRVLNNSLCHINEKRLVADSSNILNEIQAFMDVFDKERALEPAFLSRTLFLTKKMALRSFFCRGAQGTFYRRYKAFKDLLLTEPYKTAVKKANVLKLCGNEKSYGKLMHFRLILLIAIMYEMRTRIRRR